MYIFWKHIFNFKSLFIEKNFFLIYTALSETGIRDLFDVIIGNEDYENAKPSPDAFLTAADRLGVSPQDCWAFEDS